MSDEARDFLFIALPSALGALISLWLFSQVDGFFAWWRRDGRTWWKQQRCYHAWERELVAATRDVHGAPVRIIGRGLRCKRCGAQRDELEDE